MTPEIVLDNVSYTRAERQIIAPLSLRLGERRIGIVGRNGSGKSTLVRLMAGLIAPDAGSVRVGGVEVLRDRKGAVRVIGVLFQNPDHQIIFPTVIEEIAFGLRQIGHSPGAAEEAAQAMLARFGRAHWAGRTAHTLSQGQRHLLCLMSVLAMAPRVIVLDEPYAGLDLPTRLGLDRVLAGLEQSVVQVTHQIEGLRGYDRVLWLDRGRIAGDGPAAQVLEQYHAAMSAAGQADAFTDV